MFLSTNKVRRLLDVESQNANNPDQAWMPRSRAFLNPRRHNPATPAEYHLASSEKVGAQFPSRSVLKGQAPDLLRDISLERGREIDSSRKT
jgi:hypothetical protein